MFRASAAWHDKLLIDGIVDHADTSGQVERWMQLHPALPIPIPSIDTDRVRLIEAVTAKENYLLRRRIVGHLRSAAIVWLRIWVDCPAVDIQ